MKEVYNDIVLSQIPRILGFGDREPNSKTVGCFDRYYWHYKLIDFPNARFQEASLLLALLYKSDFAGNIYLGKRKIEELAKASISFWDKIQNKDGSFNEIYPNERSFCATSFSTYAITESLLIFGEQQKLNSVIKAGEWLLKNNNKVVSNQIAAASLALYNIYLLTDEMRFKKGAEEKSMALMKNQSSEGFYPEYGGCDIGYHSLTLSCLCKYYFKAKDEKLKLSMKKGLKFLNGLINGNGTFDYSETSRKTQFLYPYAFVVLESNISEKIYKGLKENKIINPHWLDDRYVIQLTTDYLWTYLEERKCI